MTVDLVDEQERPAPAERLRELAEHVLVAEGVPADMELTVLLMDEPAVAELNREHLGEEGPTDVLAFPLDAPDEAGAGAAGADEASAGAAPRVLGDVVLCPPVAARQARAGETAELEMLLVHGVLHLLGHDHAEERERRVMFARTDELLADFRAVGERGAAAPASPSSEGPR